jgi:hypothetical protein
LLLAATIDGRKTRHECDRRNDRREAQPKRNWLDDTVYLAAAADLGCHTFLTDDNQLASFADITVEELP